MSHNFFPILSLIRRKMDSLSSCCATITHWKCLELHDFVPILFLKKNLGNLGRTQTAYESHWFSYTKYLKT